MATNLVSIIGDTGTISLKATNVTSVDPIEFISASYRPGPDERRVISVFLNVAGKSCELRFEFFEPSFPEIDIVGKKLYDYVRF